jgi:hypothetical protein
MLTEPDMQARYVAATLDVLSAELQVLDLPADRRTAVLALVTDATREAHRLGDALAPSQSARRASSRRAVAPGANVLPFRARS